MKKHFFFSILLFMTISIKAQINIDLKTYLEGPFFGTEMTPWLNAFGKLPMTQPYGVSPWYYFGNESVASMPNANVIDWVLVEIRQSTGDAASAKQDSLVIRQVAFLLKNGLIRGLDGTSLLSMNIQVYTNLYAVVYHHNHITTMSALPLTNNGGIYSYDFSTGPSVVYGGTTGHKQIGTNIWGQISGDGNSDGNITQSDKISVWKPQSGQSGYLNGDFNMNSQVDNTDKSSYWRPNSGRSTQVPSFGGLNTQPSAILNVNPVIGSTITVFTLDATNSYDAQTLAPLLAVRWDFENDGTWDTPYSYNKTVTHQYPVPGDYTLKAEVIDIGGLTDTETYTINVAQSYGVSCPGIPTVTYEGQVYNTVLIGTQCWMKENLNVGTMVNGNQEQTDNQLIEKYCYNNVPANCAIYGGMYQWDELMQYTNLPGSKGICPTGWHVPRLEEWNTLVDFLGGIAVAGGKMKENGLLHWNPPNTGATNESGFTAFPGGSRPVSAYFTDLGNTANFWSSTEGYSTYAWLLTLLTYDAGVLSSYTPQTGAISARCILDPIPPVWSCGQPLPITHTAGDVAPVNKTVNYGTIETNLSGSNKCWITQNLGSDHQAVSATDATEESAGWYWQFNRKQGYKHNGTTRTPNTTWITSIDENSDWLPANDPCTLLLGTGWRLPTNSEWTNADANGGWDNYTQTYASVLRLHANGYITNSSGSLSDRGSIGIYRSSTQYNSTNGWGLTFNNSYSNISGYEKAGGFSVRCIIDEANVAWSCGQLLPVTHTAGDIAPVNKAVDYGTVETNLTGSNKCWITQNLGSDHQAISATDASEESAGWYWQFNKKQGYKHDGSDRTPNTIWISSINENSNWLPENDPCTLLLGTDWRLPTYTEWNNADINGGWNNYNQIYASVVKLHAAGYLDYSGGSLEFRGSYGYSYGYYWGSTQASSTNGWYLTFGIGYSYMYDYNKAASVSARCIRDITPTTWSCGQLLSITHTTGDIAPVNKTVNYRTVETNLTGSNKCWITQNLGSDHQAVSATDNTEESAGWYWQFNRKQGYKHDGSTRTPNTTWITSINESSDWLPANDPCTLLLGTGWRLPTSTEWTNADANGGWNNYNDSYSSVLKLHAAGYLAGSSSSLENRGSNGYYWCSTQGSSTYGWGLGFSSGGSIVNNVGGKANGFSGRCLKD